MLLDKAKITFAYVIKDLEMNWLSWIICVSWRCNHIYIYKRKAEGDLTQRKRCEWYGRSQGMLESPEAAEGQEDTAPQSLWREQDVPADTFMSTTGHWFQSSGLRNCERTNLCCSRPPSLWYLVTTALGNENIRFKVFLVLISLCYPWVFSKWLKKKKTKFKK